MNEIIERDGACLICKGSDLLQVHHLIPRRFKHLADDPRNLATLCAVCHEAVERREKGFAHWKVSTKGDVDAGRLEMFWEQFHAEGGVGGWKAPPSDSEMMKLLPMSYVQESGIVQLAQSAPVQRPTGDDIVDFRATLSRIATDYVSLAVLADRIKELKLYEPEHETFDDFLEDAKLERSKGFRLAQLGRYIRLSGATDQLPMARWNKLLPLIHFDGEKVANAPAVRELVEKAQVLSERDFRIVVQEAAHHAVHPETPLPIAQDAIIYDAAGTLIGRVTRAWKGDGCVHFQALIKDEFCNKSMEVSIR